MVRASRGYSELSQMWVWLWLLQMLIGVPALCFSVVELLPKGQH